MPKRPGEEDTPTATWLRSGTSSWTARFHRQNLRWKETVVKDAAAGFIQPSVTMEGGEGLLTAFGLGFTPHIQRQACTDLHLRAYPVDLFLPLAIAPVAPLHRIRRRWQQLVIKKRQGFVQRGGKESFFSVSPREVNRWTRRRNFASLSRAVWVRQRRSNNAYTCSMIARSACHWGNPRLTRHRVFRSVLLR